MKTRVIWICTLAVLLITLTLGADEKVKFRTVEAQAIKLRVPESWESVKVSSKFRAAQFKISGKTVDDENADLVVYHFGGPTGGIKSNVGRWIGQFYEKDRKVKLVRGKSKQGDYVLADVSGTWKKPDGPPFARKTIDKPGSRVIGVILIVGQEETKDYYFIKLSGPDALVKSQASALRTALFVDPKSENLFELKDAEN